MIKVSSYIRYIPFENMKCRKDTKKEFNFLKELRKAFIRVV